MTNISPFVNSHYGNWVIKKWLITKSWPILSTRIENISTSTINQPLLLTNRIAGFFFVIYDKLLLANSISTKKQPAL